MQPTPNWKMKTLPLALTLAIAAMVSSTATAEIKSIAGIDLSKYADYLEHAAEIRIGPESFAFLKMNSHYCPEISSNKFNWLDNCSSSGLDAVFVTS